MTRFSSIFEDAAMAARHIRGVASEKNLAVTNARINEIVHRLAGVDDWPEVRRRVESALFSAPYVVEDNTPAAPVPMEVVMAIPEPAPAPEPEPELVLIEQAPEEILIAAEVEPESE